jgi:hypothetical protein
MSTSSATLFPTEKSIQGKKSTRKSSRLAGRSLSLDRGSLSVVGETGKEKEKEKEKEKGEEESEEETEEEVERIIREATERMKKRKEGELTLEKATQEGKIMKWCVQEIQKNQQVAEDYSKEVEKLKREKKALEKELKDLKGRSPSVGVPTFSIKIAEPTKFDGRDRSKYLQFLRSCELFFSSNASGYADTYVKLITAISYLEGPPLEYFHTLLYRDTKPLVTWEEFKAKFTSMYGDVNMEETATLKLLSLKQERSHISDFTTDFLSLVAKTTIPNLQLRTLFKAGLSDPIKRKIANIPSSLQPTGWDEFRNWVLEMENHYENTIALTTPRFRSPAPSNQQTPKPKIPGNAGSTPTVPEHRKGKLTSELRLILAAEKRCFFCRQVGHDMSGCPRLPRKNVGPSSTPKTNVSSTEITPETKIEIIDSDSENVTTSSDTSPNDSYCFPSGVTSNSNPIPFVEKKALVNDEKVCVSTIQKKN